MSNYQDLFLNERLCDQTAEPLAMLTFTFAV